MRAVIFMILLPAITGSAEIASDQSGSEQEAPVSLRIEAPKTAIALGAKMELRATITNKSGKSLLLVNRGVYKGRPVHRLGAWVRDNAGKEVLKTAYGWIMVGVVIEEDPSKMRNKAGTPVVRQRETAYLLEAGKTDLDEFDLTREFEITRPGIYTVNVAMYDPLSPGRILTSNTITFSVTQ